MFLRFNKQTSVQNQSKIDWIFRPSHNNPNPQLNFDHLFNPRLQTQKNPLPPNNPIPSFNLPKLPITTQMLHHIDPPNPGLNHLLSHLIQSQRPVPQNKPIPNSLNTNPIPEDPLKPIELLQIQTLD
jgi:hypothetical protein